MIAERNPTHDMLKEMIKLYMANCKSTLVLNCILASFEPALVSDNALAMCELIKAADATAYPKYHLYVSLGAAMCAFPPPKETQLQIINDVWAEIAKIKSAREYTPIAAQFVRFLLKEFTFDEVRKLRPREARPGAAGTAAAGGGPRARGVWDDVRLWDGVRDGAVHEAAHVLRRRDPDAELQDGPRRLQQGAGHHRRPRPRLEPDAGGDAAPRLMSRPFYSPHLYRWRSSSTTRSTRKSFDDERRQLAWLINAFVRKISFGNDYEEHL